MKAEPVEAALQQLVTAVAVLPEVRSIGLSGGDRPLPRPGEGDLDLFVYCTAIPDPDRRRSVLETLPDLARDIDVGRSQGGVWGHADSLWLVGVETWLMHFQAAEARQELADLLAGRYPGRLDDYYYPLGRCATWQTMRPLYDPDGLLASFRQALSPYPAELAAQLLTHHLDALADTEDLDWAVARGDLLFYHFALDLALDHLLQALFALNRAYFPSRKRSLERVAGFDLRPAGCEPRLREVVALGGTVETLRRSQAVWQALVADLKALMDYAPA
jgi:hypothetical protein